MAKKFMKPEFIIIHHSAVSRALAPKQYEAVKDYHRSLGWGKIGYHYFIESDGSMHKGRFDESVGTHFRHGEMYFNSIGICLAGDFMMESPTDEQIYKLRDILKTLVSKYNIPEKNILGHKETGAATLCPGEKIDLKFIRELPSRE